LSAKDGGRRVERQSRFETNDFDYGSEEEAEKQKGKRLGNPDSRVTLGGLRHHGTLFLKLHRIARHGPAIRLERGQQLADYDVQTRNRARFIYSFNFIVRRGIASTVYLTDRITRHHQ
jgi:hypothetical protein